MADKIRKLLSRRENASSFWWPKNRKVNGIHKERGEQSMSVASVQMEGVKDQAIPEAGEAFVRGLRNGFLRRRRSPAPRMKIPTAEEMMAEAWRNVGDHLRGAMAEVDVEITRRQ